jgi:hypothetical protein
MKKSSSSNLMGGLKNTAPAGVDKSMSIPKGSTVNNDTTRGSVAPTPGTLGGRCA